MAYSSGGAIERSPPQICDAIDVCKHGCPTGMTKVASPERSRVYTLRTGDGPNVWQDTKAFVPGELLTLYVRVTKRVIAGKGWCPCPCWYNPDYWCECRCIKPLESSKYIGLLLYAVKTGDTTETKVGSWEVPLQEPVKFWSPPDEPGCGGRAVMHRYAEPKHYLERLVFRAPPAGTAPSITFRVLIKQGDTNMGAFYWPHVPASDTPDLPPLAGRSGGDLVLFEAPPPPSPRLW